MGFSYKNGNATINWNEAQIANCFKVPKYPWVKMYANNNAGANSKMFIFIDTAILWKTNKIFSIM